MRIAFTGAQGTGKSTLASKVAAHFGLPVLPTPGRLMSVRNLPVNEDATVESQTLAWLIQVELESKESDWIAPRSLIDIWAYAALAYRRQRPTALSAELLAQLERTTRLLLPGRYDVLAYLPPRIPLAADEVRSSDLDFQRATDVEIQCALVTWSVDYMELDVTDPRVADYLISVVEQRTR